MTRGKLNRYAERARADAEAKAGIHEGHYLLGDQFVCVWVSFYPKVRWWIADAARPSGEKVEGTTRELDAETKANLRTWL